jgi:hypothetical protein
MPRKYVVRANNPSKGMTAKEIRDALDGCPDDVVPVVFVKWRGQIKTIEIEP